MAQRLRILHCLRAPVGGLFRHVLDLAQEQAGRGHAVGIIADSTSFDRLTAGRFAAIGPQLELGITTTPMSRRPSLSDIAAYKVVRETARRLDADILHGHGAKGGAYARLARRALRAQGRRIASFYTPHGGSLNFRPGTLEFAFFINLEKMLDRLTDGLVFESAYAANTYRARVGNGGASQRVVPNGLKQQDFFSHEPCANAADFLFLGELRSVKGVDVLLRALRRVNDLRPASAVIVGSGPESEHLQALAHELSLGDRVTFPGALPAREAMAKGRIFVVPSLAESFPYVVLEAAAAGMPLLSTNVGGIPEMVRGTDTALMTPGDAHVLASAMLTTLDCLDAARERARRLQNAVARRFTVENMAASVLDFYSAALRSDPMTTSSPAAAEPSLTFR